MASQELMDKVVVACGGWACHLDPRYHAVLAVKVCTLAGERLRPAAVFEP
jgi:hypothetical protein